jgi:release factor glutamine methyltransferase
MSIAGVAVRHVVFSSVAGDARRRWTVDVVRPAAGTIRERHRRRRRLARVRTSTLCAMTLRTARADLCPGDERLPFNRAEGPHLPSWSRARGVSSGTDTVGAVLCDVVDLLRAAGCVFAEDEARLLIDAATDPHELESMVARRVGGEPLEQVLGWAEFCGLRVAVEPGVFVPRRRTEVLVREALILAGQRRRLVVVDLCCGTGAIGLAVARGLAAAELHAADVDPVAVRCARRNVEPIGGTVHEGDLYAALPPRLQGRIDLLLVNAPYVPSDAVALMPPEARDHEPRQALDGGADGLDVQRRVIAAAAAWLAPDGALLVETGHDQAAGTSGAMAEAGLVPRTGHDEELDGTVAVGTRPLARGQAFQEVSG